MGTVAVSRMLSTHLYYRRSFPFYTFNIVGGLDDEGALRATVKVGVHLCAAFATWSSHVGLPTFCVRKHSKFAYWC